MAYRRGHVKGTKREQHGSGDWYVVQGHAQYWIDKVTKEWAAKQAQQQPKRVA